MTEVFSSIYNLCLLGLVTLGTLAYIGLAIQHNQTNKLEQFLEKYEEFEKTKTNKK